MKEKICMFCRLPKEVFTDEHVFPAAMGGNFIILTVCKDCNTTLGKHIDNPLSTNRIILYYRKIFDIKRKGISGERSIQNPFKGTENAVDKDGNDHYVSFNEENKSFETNLIRQYETPIPAEGGGWIGKMTLPLKEFKNEDEIKKQYAKKFGLDPAEIASIKKEIQPRTEVTVRLGDSNRTLILGCLKIAYEYTMTFLPAYWEDPSSKAFANILLTGNIKEDEKDLFDYDFSVREEFTERISKIENLKACHHVALLTTIKGKGLYCLVKIFDWMYAIRLSKLEDYLQAKELLLLNDSISQVYWINIPTRLSDFSLFLNTASLHYQRRLNVESSKGLGFSTPDGKIPIFNKKGKLIYKHLEELANNIQMSPPNYDHLNKKIVVPISYEANKYFVKFIKGNFLIPLQQVNYTYLLLY